MRAILFGLNYPYEKRKFLFLLENIAKCVILVVQTINNPKNFLMSKNSINNSSEQEQSELFPLSVVGGKRHRPALILPIFRAWAVCYWFGSVSSRGVSSPPFPP